MDKDDRFSLTEHSLAETLSALPKNIRDYVLPVFRVRYPEHLWTVNRDGSVRVQRIVS